MKLLAVEARQNATYYLSRYRQVEALGIELYVLNGEGTPDFWPAARYRIAGSRQIAELTAAAARWHRTERFDGVLTFSESAVVAVAAIAAELGLPGIGVDAARTSRNKLLMRQAHERGKAAHPAFRLVGDEAEALAAATDFGLPAIVKPTLGAASNYVFRVDDATQVAERFADAARGIQNMTWFQMEAEGIDIGPHGLLVESFLDGHEHLLEAVAWDGEVYIGSVVDRVTAEGATFDDDVHRAPTALDADQLAAMHREVKAAALAQGLRRAVLHAEVRFHQGRPHILEIAVRPGGGGLDYMARVSGGYCPIRASVDVACGIRPNVDHYAPTATHTAALCLMSDAGVVEAISVPDEVTQSPGLVFCKVTARRGDVMRRPPEGNSVAGYLVAQGDSFNQAMATANRLAGQIQIQMAESHPPFTRIEAIP